MEEINATDRCPACTKHPRPIWGMNLAGFGTDHYGKGNCYLHECNRGVEPSQITLIAKQLTRLAKELTDIAERLGIYSTLGSKD